MWQGLVAILLLANGTDPLPGQALWDAFEPLCGKAFEGRMTKGTDPSDKAFGEQDMIMHVTHCSENEIRIPFHVGENRSRTWVLTRSPDHVRLKHDHRHEDSSPDEITQYGGDVPGSDELSVDFPADDYTAKMLPAAATNIWTIAIEPGKTFSYALRREEQGRYFKIEFDLGTAVELPPPAW